MLVDSFGGGGDVIKDTGGGESAKEYTVTFSFCGCDGNLV